ncbi:DUF4232 domain-containing protein [Solicola sp. PLA-1-18]|uniref:DUF4232 domain-containing protein n=1 Tax=Solicola sp. PLA-1-18 TaxID=3380532 RepID=UPI003B7C893D
MQLKHGCLIGLGAAVLVLSGCGAGSAGDAAPAAPSAHVETRSDAATAPATSASPSAGPTRSPATDGASSGVPLCGTPDLAVSLRTPAGGGTAGSTYRELVLRNDSGHRCSLDGWSGVSFVAGDAGRQVGRAASRVDAGRRSRVVLAAGGVATERLRQVDPGAQGCRTTEVDGLRVYPPHNRESAFVRVPVTACASASVDQLQVSPVAG